MLAISAALHCAVDRELILQSIDAAVLCFCSAMLLQYCGVPDQMRNVSSRFCISCIEIYEYTRHTELIVGTIRLN